MVRMCDLKAECRSSLPVAVTLKRFATALEDLPLRLAALAFFMTELIAGEDASDGAPAAGTSTRTGATPVGRRPALARGPPLGGGRAREPAPPQFLGGGDPAPASVPQSAHQLLRSFEEAEIPLCSLAERGKRSLP